MDDIYGDLENYNDVNVIDELRKENRELKFKLEEYASSMDKLQKDFDKLSVEFKKLEVNYSSLLKTAKAEIERKTQIITNLNMEKDMLVLSSIQNSNKGLSVLRRNMIREKSNNRKSRKDDMDAMKTNKKDVQELKKQEPGKLRNDENRLPSIDTLSSANADDTNKIVNSENKPNKLDSYDKTSESKENIAKCKRALSLKHRRKSMPVLSKQATFSSDEDDCSDDGNKRERPSREDKSRKYFDRHKVSHKISETSGIDEKYSSYHESSRETYFRGKCKYADKYRFARDKSRHRKHFSPDKNRRVTRDYREDDTDDIMKHNRVLVSPAREEYDPARLYRDRRSNYERDKSHEERHMRRDDSRENKQMPRENIHEEKQRYSFHEERVRLKGVFQEEKYRQRSDSHEERRKKRVASPEDNYKQRHISAEDIGRQRDKQKEDFQEESHKQRSDACIEMSKERGDSLDTRTKNKESNEEKQRAVNNDKKRKQRSRSREEKSCPEGPVKNKISSDYDEPSSKRARLECRKPVEDKWMPEFAQHLQHTSCQSPDNPHLDAPTVSMLTKPKEIRHTAVTKLDDPRFTSNKYVKELEGEKVILTTVTGRNKEMVAVNFTKWDIKRIDVPKLLQKPPQYTNEMVRDVYMDKDNPASNLSLESGEINSESSDIRMADYLSQNFYEDYENERLKQIEARVEKEALTVKHKREARMEQVVHKDDNIDVGNKVGPLNTEPKLPPVKYKMPRTTEIEQSTLTNPLGILLKQFNSVCGVDTPTKPPEAKLNVDETFGLDDDTKDEETKDKKVKPKETRTLRQRKMSTIELVEGDLALSDETSDNIFKKQNKKENLKAQSTDNSKNISQKNTEELENGTVKPVKVAKKKTRKSKTESKVKDQKVEESETTKNTESQTGEKNNKKTRKKTKQKVISVKEDVKTADVGDTAEKKSKGRKSKSPKNNTNVSKETKFTYLFGDSSSLITPEDLGMVSEAHTETANKYVPIFEDAQDAVDVNVMKNNESEVTPSVTSSKIDEPVLVSEETPKSLMCKISIPKSISTTNLTESNDTLHQSVQKITPNIEVLDDIVTKEPDVVKTVIISTGVQPQIEDVDNQEKNLTEKSDNVVTKINDVSIPLALATSTPHKRLLLQLEAQIDSARSCNSSEVQKDESSSVEQSTMSNGVSCEAQDDDQPEFRVIVKRRRRFKK